MGLPVKQECLLLQKHLKFILCHCPMAFSTGIRLPRDGAAHELHPGKTFLGTTQQAVLANPGRADHRNENASLSSRVTGHLLLNLLTSICRSAAASRTAAS